MAPTTRARPGAAVAVLFLLFGVLAAVVLVPPRGARADQVDDQDIRPYGDEDLGTAAAAGAWGPAVRTRRELLRAMSQAEHAEVLLAGEGEGEGEAHHKRMANAKNIHEIFPASVEASVPEVSEVEGEGEGDEAAWVAKYLGDHRDVESRRFAELMPDLSTVFGHVFYISNPQRHFTVQPPAGGCGVRSTVSATAQAEGCIVACNAGFFNTRDGACLGNLISDGVVIQNTGRHNANFGMRKDGSFGVGYFGAEDVSRGNETDWAQLVAGVMWLVRNGRSYVSQSSMLEDLSIQETGSSFVTVTSARNSIGHDARGRLMLVLVNGKTYQRGISLPLFAKLLVSLGAVNAINLDGGGSAQMVQRGVMVNFPSDECYDNKRFTCERPVSSIVCIRP